MAATSSTSSSEPAKAPTAPHGPRPHAPLGRPWALLLALVIIAGVEVYLHTRDRMSLIAYASDEGQYHAVRDTVAAQGVADVALVGSSQMREGVEMPGLLAEVQKRLGRPVRVANYATRGARLDAMNAVVRYLLKQPKPPELIVIGLSQRDLRADTVDWPRVALFWDFHDWRTAYGQYGWPVTDVLPVVIRNQASQVLDTLRYREEISLTLQRPFERFGVDAKEDGNPILGEMTDQHMGGRGMRNMVNPGASPRKILQRAMDSYEIKQPPTPRPVMAGQLHELVDAFAGQPQRGLLVQMPNAELLQTFLEQNGQTAAFGQIVSAEAQAAGVRFIPLSNQDFHPDNRHFSDLQHLNRPGAESFGIWLANVIADRLSNPSR